MPSAGDAFLARKIEEKHKMVHIFHFLQTGIVFETVSSFSGIFNAISISVFYRFIYLFVFMVGVITERFLPTQYM